MDNIFERQSLSEIKNDLRELLADGNDPYSVAFFGITMRYALTTSNSSDEHLTAFIEERLSKIDGLKEIFLLNSDSEILSDYMLLLNTYYLFTRDKRSFRKIVNWLPNLTPKQKQVIMTWPEKMVLSVFNSFERDGAVYYQDVKNNQIYQMLFIDSDLNQNETEFDYSLLTLLVPTETLFLSVPPMICQPDEDLKKAFQNAKNETESELAAIDWYSSTFSELSDLSSEIPEDEFYSAAKNENESTADFAKRLLEQDEKVLSFEHYNHMETLLIKVIDTFPQLFFARANALALIEGLKQVFTFEEDVEDYLDPDLMNDFWYLLIREQLPEEVKRIKPYQVSEEYWDSFDDFPF